MTGYGQFCPIAKAAEVVAERWTPLVLRELLCGSSRYSEIRRGVPLMSPSLLSKRLQELEAAGIVEKRRAGRVSEYRLTASGEDLRPVIMALGDWGTRWTDGRLALADYDPSVLLWDMRRRVRHEQLPAGRVVIHFNFPDGPPGKHEFWLVLEDGDADVCLNDPGFDPDIHAISRVRLLADVWLGKRRMADVIRSGELELIGPRPLVRQFDQWFSLSVFASPRQTPAASPA